MIRFVNLTEALESSEPICAFFDTVRDRFIETKMKDQTFSSPEFIALHDQGQRMLRLVPDGFFDRAVCDTCGESTADKYTYAGRGPLCGKCHDAAMEIDEKT